jgi:hypothetical protein
MNITTFTVDNFDGTTTDWVQIETAPEQFTSMTKETYEATLAANSAPTA